MNKRYSTPGEPILFSDLLFSERLMVLDAHIPKEALSAEAAIDVINILDEIFTEINPYLVFEKRHKKHTVRIDDQNNAVHRIQERIHLAIQVIQSSK